MKRLFIAIGLPSEIKKKLEARQTELKRYARDAKWVRPDGIHLTLKFLGYVEPDRISSISSELKPIASSFSPFTVRIKGFGFFPNARRPNVLWAGVDSPPLHDLQPKVEEAMNRLGFEKENRVFSPHLTMSRFRESRGVLPLAQQVEKICDQEEAEFMANDFTLYESILKREGAEYHALEKFAFAQ